MPKAYEPEYKPRPDAPGFWVDAYLTNYGCAIVESRGKLYALGWAAQPTPVEELRIIHHRKDIDGQLIAGGGWYGPCPVPSCRRYEIRKLKREFADNRPA